MENMDDKILSAYLDGELPADEVDELEKQLSGDADLQRRLDAMRTADDATRKLFAAVDAAPMPVAVMQMLGQEAKEPDNVVAFPPRGLGRFLQMPVAIAASVALAVGFMVSELSQQAPATSIESLSARSINPDSTLHNLLENTGSGQDTDLGNGENGAALLSFEDQTGRFCRQVRVDSANSAAHAVACRLDNAWQVEAVAFSELVGDGQFQTAASAVPVTILATVDDLLGAAEPLEEEQENQAISNSWKKID